MALSAPVIAALDSQHFDVRYFLKLELDSETLYYSTDPNGGSFDGNDYTYLSGIGDIGDLDQSDQIEPTDLSISIGGVDPVVLAKFLSEPLINRRISIYFIVYQNGVQVGEMDRFDGIMQPPAIQQGESSAIGIPVKDALADWDRNKKLLYTDAEQKRINPLDNCLSQISNLASRVIRWPAASFWD